MTAWVIQWLHRKNVRSRAMGEDTFTFRVDEELKRQFATAARARDRSAAQLLRDYMRAFVAELTTWGYNRSARSSAVVFPTPEMPSTVAPSCIGYLSGVTMQGP